MTLFNSRVFLIDHAWTFRLNEARPALDENEALLERMCKLMNIKIDEDEEVSTVKDSKIEAVMENMWKFNQTYKLSTHRMVLFHLSKNIYRIV